MRILVVVAMLIICYETNADPRLCGHNLDQAMLVVCGPNGFNTRLKKSVGLGGSLDPAGDSNALADIYLSEEANLMTKIRRRRDRIVDECCNLKGCTFGELYAYCRE